MEDKIRELDEIDNLYLYDDIDNRGYNFLKFIAKELINISNKLEAICNDR